jgi:elongation factor Ts
MAEISAKLVKELREKTGCGMMDCKKALKETDGDISEAIDVLRKSGIAKAEKKSGRTAKEGIIATKVTANGSAAIELLCETDFVAKNDKFKAYANEILDKVLALDCDGDAAEQINEIEKDNLTSMIATIGENMQIRRAARWNGSCGAYIHGGGRIGVMIELEGEEAPATDICMHIAAFNPMYICSKCIPEAIVEKEKEIHTAQLAGKPENMIEKIIIGKLAKWHKEVCLNDQPWIRDDKTSVSKANPNTKVKRFVRWQVGEVL